MLKQTAVLLPLALATMGCFSYAPLGDAGPFPARGGPVRAFLKTPMSVQLTDLAVDNVVVVEGEFVNWESGTFTLSATWLEAAGRREFKAIGETVTIPSAQLDHVERRVVSAPKTVGLLGVGALVSVLGNFALTGGSGGSTGGGKSTTK